MNIINKTKSQDNKRPLKRSKTGFEVEMHILNDDGSISYKGFNLVKKIKKTHPHLDVVKECGKNMLEINSYPDINTYNPALEMIETIERVIEIAKIHNLKIYPFSTYPGKIIPHFTPDKTGKYKIQEKIYGKEKFGLATKVIGFHHHYAMPKGVFDEKEKNLRLLIDSKLKRSLMNSYNFEIAIDPILTLLSQSSPFFEGKYLAKNSRMLVYRGGKKLKSSEGFYSNHQLIGGLPPYKQTETDLIRSLKLKQNKWRKLVKQVDSDIDFDKLYPFKLDIAWNPIKINKHGTIEQRGMDMNYMSIMLGISALVKFCLKKIQREFIEVIPSDKGINESFYVKKGIMYIPPHSYVRHKLQKYSAYKGFENDELYEYTKRFFRFAKKLSPKFYYPLYENIEKMIKKRKSISDEMLLYARRKNLIKESGFITKENAQKIALYFSKEFEKDLIKTKEIVLQIMEAHKDSMNN